jgi:hypothetical protein
MLRPRASASLHFDALITRLIGTPFNRQARSSARTVAGIHWKSQGGIMIRLTMAATGLLLAGSLFVTEARAQSGLPPLPAPGPVGSGSYIQGGPVTTSPSSMRAVMSPSMQQLPPRAGYPYLNAPLYPTPAQNVPAQVGGTMITNQAFAPHEMLYAHEYRSMYGPFYYKVKGSWLWTPFGIESHDKWELMGTEVKVKYRSTYSLGSLFTPPRMSLR